MRGDKLERTAQPTPGPAPFCTHHPLAEPQLSHFFFPFLCAFLFFFLSFSPPPLSSSSSAPSPLTDDAGFLVHISVRAIMMGDNDSTDLKSYKLPETRTKRAQQMCGGEARRRRERERAEERGRNNK